MLAVERAARVGRRGRSEAQAPSAPAAASHAASAIGTATMIAVPGSPAAEAKRMGVRSRTTSCCVRDQVSGGRRRQDHVPVRPDRQQRGVPRRSSEAEPDLRQDLSNRVVLANGPVKPVPCVVCCRRAANRSVAIRRQRAANRDGPRPSAAWRWSMNRMLVMAGVVAAAAACVSRPPTAGTEADQAPCRGTNGRDRAACR